MAFQQTPFGEFWLPTPYGLISPPAISATPSITAAGMKMAFIGNVVWGDRAATKSISKILWRQGAVTKVGGSTLKVSLQNVSTTLTPAQPDGTVLQSYTLTNAEMVSSAWYPGATLGAAQSVNLGQLIAVVWEFATFAGSDSVAWGGLNGCWNQCDQTSVISFYNNTVWAAQAAMLPTILFQFSDGTYGTFQMQSPFPFVSAGPTTVIYNSGSSPNEYALKFQLPYPVKIDSVGAALTVAAGANFSVAIYDGTTPLVTVNVDAHSVSSPGSQRLCTVHLGSEIALSANHAYYAAFKATAANSLTLPYVVVAAAAHMAAYSGGANFYMSQRSGGAWTDTNTQRPIINIGVSSFDDGTGSGGGGTNLFMVQD